MAEGSAPETDVGPPRCPGTERRCHSPEWCHARQACSIEAEAQAKATEVEAEAKAKAKAKADSQRKLLLLEDAKAYARIAGLTFLGTSAGEPVFIRASDVVAVLTRPNGLQPMVFLAGIPGRPVFVDDTTYLEVLKALADARAARIRDELDGGAAAEAEKRALARERQRWP